MLGRYNFTEFCKILSNENRLILTNRGTGGWLKISKQCYGVLKLGIDNNLTEGELLSKLADDDDRNYFASLFEKLKELDVIYDIDKDGVRSIKKIDKIDTIYFALTNRCNLNCIHCSVNAQLSIEEDYLNTECIFRIIDKIKEYNPKNLIFTGGEPLLRKDFIEILKYTSKVYSGNISIMTNGTLISRKNVKVLSLLLNCIDISIDGVDEETCSIIRGKGVFEKVMNSVKLLQENDFNKITLSMVLTKNNENFMERFRQLNDELRTRPIFRVYMSLGRGKTNRNKLMTPVMQIHEDKLSGQTKHSNRDMRACSCGAGYKELFINYDGEMYPCNLLIGDRYKIGSINDIEVIGSYFENLNCSESLSYKALNEIQPDVYHRCKDCNVNMFCWTCLVELDKLRENIELFNEKCIESKNYLTKELWG